LDILISTPERLTFHLDNKHINLDDTRILVVDEADTLVNTELYLTQLETVIHELLNPKRGALAVVLARTPQIVWVSATVSIPVAQYIEKHFKDTVQVFSHQVHRSVAGLRQNFLFGSGGKWKERLVLSCLKTHKGQRTMIFCNTTEQCKSVHAFLKKQSYNLAILTSDINSKKRATHFHDFNTGKIPILIATDLASRGIDTEVTVSHIILYDFPKTAIDYLHRIGRTARAGTKGTVSGFVGKQDEALACQIRDAFSDGISLANVSAIAPKKVKGKTRKAEVIDPKYLNENVT